MYKIQRERARERERGREGFGIDMPERGRGSGVLGTLILREIFLGVFGFLLPFETESSLLMFL